MAGWSRPSSPLFLILFAGVLVVMSVIAAERGVSDVLGYLLQTHLDAWAEEAEAPAIEQWETANSFYSNALKLTPSDPALLQQGGQLYEWKAVIMADDDRTAAAAMRQALQYYERSLHLRPSWPYAWTDYATARARAGHFDDSFQHAFSRALELGPWEEQVQLGISRLGLSAWSRLSRENRRSLMLNMRKFAARQWRQLVKMAEQTATLPIVCYGIRNNVQLEKACRHQGVLRSDT